MLLNKQKTLMFTPFLKEITTKHTASEIAKKYKLNQKSVYLFLEELEKKAIIKSEFQGKNKLYELKKENKETVIHFLCSIEHLRTLYFYENNPDIKTIIEKMLQHIQGTIILFGSYAKEMQKNTSDLDVFIVGKYDTKKISEIADTYNIPINIKNQKKLTLNPLTQEIKKHHILIKNTETFVRWMHG